MVAFGRIVLLAVVAWACGGKSVSVQGDGDDDHAVGGSDGGRGGQAGFAGAPRGGTSTGATGGVSTGGGVGLGGSPGTGGMVVGGQAGTGGDACPPGVFTTISGTVRDPAGELPLYNVIVYEPSGPLTPMREGIDCDPCAEIEPRPLNAALTDTRGQFVLQVSPTYFVPVVVQTGKWRREINVGPVVPCMNTEFDDPDLFRLPRSQAEGHMPRIALVTGAEDSLECMLRRFGIGDFEFTTDSGDGAVNLYVGCAASWGTGADHFVDTLGGGSFPSASELFADPEKLASYDLVLLGCEGAHCEADKDPYVENLQRYADSGGYLFLDHLQSYWMWGGSPEWRAAAEFDPDPHSTSREITASVDQTFPKGLALSEWLINVEASTSVGEVPVSLGGESVRAVLAPTQRWIYRDTSVLSMTMNTPVELPWNEQCGRVVFNDFHAHNPGELSRSASAFPDGCRGGPLSPQEAAMAFQLLDNIICVSIEGSPRPVPPP